MKNEGDTFAVATNFVDQVPLRLIWIADPDASSGLPTLMPHPYDGRQRLTTTIWQWNLPAHIEYLKGEGHRLSQVEIDM